MRNWRTSRVLTPSLASSAAEDRHPMHVIGLLLLARQTPLCGQENPLAEARRLRVYPCKADAGFDHGPPASMFIQGPISSRS
jgi:hypothetical protein